MKKVLPLVLNFVWDSLRRRKLLNGSIQAFLDGFPQLSPTQVGEALSF